MNNKYIVNGKRENNDNKSMNMKDKSVRLQSRLFLYKTRLPRDAV